MLTREEARAFYDRFGARQDRQGWYEDSALRDLLAHGDFEGAESVVEFGCGTGRLAAELLRDHLPESARYRGYDLSSTMVELARQRLAVFGDRAEVVRSGGEMRLPMAGGSCDRFLSTYVADLLPDAEIEALFAEAHRVLAPRGYLCLASLTSGITLLSRLVTAAWNLVHRVRPALVGGCRPIEMLPFLESSVWEVSHHRRLVAWGITSEVVVARNRP